MSLDNRGMSVAQARALAADPNVATGVMVRLANGYPEVWEVLLKNPAVYPELRAWLEQAIASAAAQQNSHLETTAGVREKPAKTVAKTEVKHTRKPKRRRKRGKFAKFVSIFLPAALVLSGLFYVVDYAFEVAPAPGIISVQDIRDTPEVGAWNYDVSVPTDSECTEYSIKTFKQDFAIILIQNDLSKEKCRDLKKPTPSTLALVNTSTGVESWKIDLAAELEWTPKWRKEIVELPGLNEILIRYIDINGQDANDDTKTADDDETADRKMKTLVPYSALNGSITDPVIAQSKAQPPMKSVVIEVMPIPGHTKDVLLMTNGSNNDFRYARYRAKTLTDEKWSYESDLKPVRGNPLVGQNLILGREKDDEAKALQIKTGKVSGWNGPAGGSIFNIDGDYVHVTGDKDNKKASNVESQGGTKGKKTTISGISVTGKVTWELDCTGYALSRTDAVSSLVSRTHEGQIYALSGKSNKTVSLLDTASGDALWKTQMPEAKFEISRLSSPGFATVYLTKKGKTESSSLVLMSLADGEISKRFKIAGDKVRIDGMTNATGFVVDEPDRKQITADVEDGQNSASRDDEEEDNSDEIRTCVVGLNLANTKQLWNLDCNGNEHISRAGGNWLLFDNTAGEEVIKPLSAQGE